MFGEVVDGWEALDAIEKLGSRGGATTELLTISKTRFISKPSFNN